MNMIERKPSILEQSSVLDLMWFLFRFTKNSETYQEVADELLARGEVSLYEAVEQFGDQLYNSVDKLRDDIKRLQSRQLQA